jgi:dimethylglycine dehydrogenase
MGCGLAYHLAHEGWSDVVLLEKAELTSGSTWHAAGQITHSTSSFGLGKCVDYNIGLYSGALEAETGQSVTWHGCGSFRLAYTADEMDWLRQTLSVGRALGFNIELVGPERVRELHPFYNLDGVIGALHTPDDGHADPSGITQALATGARQLGAKIIRRCRATDIRQLPGGEWKVFTDKGDIICEHVVNAAGTYARQIGEWSDVLVPATSMTHHYLVTDTVPEFLDLERELPVIRDDKQVSGYIRMEQKSGLIGIYEKENPNAVWIDECPWEAENELFQADYDRILPWLENAMERMPVLAELGIKREVHGAISHPPDGNPLIGPVAGARNYWCCCGTQIGIGWGPGLTRELARWIVHGAADISMRDYRSAALRPLRHQGLAGGEGQGRLLPAPRDPVSAFQPARRTAGQAVAAVRAAEGQGRGVRGSLRPRTTALVRPRWPRTARLLRFQAHAGARDAVAFECTAAVRERAGHDGHLRLHQGGGVAAPMPKRFVDRLVANRLPRKPGGIALDPHAQPPRSGSNWRPRWCAWHR